MQVRKDYFEQARRSSSRLRRAVVASVAFHLFLVAGLAAGVHFWKAATPSINVLEVGFMAAGLPDAPEGIESTRDASKPPAPPEAAPAVAPPVKKPEPPKKEPEKRPEPKKEPEKKPDPKKQEKEAKKEPPKKEKPVTLPDADVGDLLNQEMKVAQNTPAPPGATPGTRAQTGYGDPLSEEQGISVKGVPSVLGSWANQVRRAVKRYWQEPGAVAIGSSVAVTFWVSSDGRLLGEPEVAGPSNDATLDQSGVNAIKLAAPFPPLPPGYNQTRQQVIFVFTIAG